MMGLTLLALVLGGCTTIAPERKSYPPAWPELASTPQRDCEPPVGTFEDTYSLDAYEYPVQSGPRQPPPRLSSVLGVSSFVSPVTHLRLTELDNDDLQIEALGIKDGQEESLSVKVLPSAAFRCQSNRWFISTTPTHEGFSGYQQEDYDPLYTAMYMVGTLGIAAPISAWWNFVFASASDGSLALRRQNMSSALLFIMFYGRAAMDDDWFLYRPTDALSMIARWENDPGFGRRETPRALPALPALPPPDACGPDPILSSQELFDQGKAFFLHKTYSQSLTCFTAAAEHREGGNREAMWYLCVMHELGYGVEKNLDVARGWCKRAAG